MGILPNLTSSRLVVRHYRTSKLSNPLDVVAFSRSMALVDAQGRPQMLGHRYA